MKKTVKIILGIVSAVMAAVCVCCILYIAQYLRGNSLNDRLASEIASRTAVAVPKPDAEEPVSTPAPEDEAQPDGAENEPQEEPHKEFRAIDFDALTELNPDIYAWIDMPGSIINYAVVQSEDKDEFYSDHAVDGGYYSGGSIFSQRYNKRDFSDPVTVLYGHNRKNGTMFAALNDFADPAYFEEHRTVYIYLSDAIYEYTVFAAYPYSSKHLLLCNDFTDEDEFNGFFEKLNDGVNTNYDREMFPVFGDKVLTLSTCYKQNRMQRYLVQAKLTARYSPAGDTAE